MSRLRTLLVLGRVSNLPTIWSNCLAGWFLGGGGNIEKLPFLFAGATFLYLGGMFLNDAFDADFDREHRIARPIPSGAISVNAVWRWSMAWLGLGSLILICVGKTTGTLGIVLLLLIVAYDALHKFIAFAPILMGGCRLLVYLVAASTGISGVTGWAAWCGLALASYIVGLSCFARGESLRESEPPYWPIAFLIVPILLASIMNAGIYRESGLLLSAVLALWLVRSLRHAFSPAERSVRKSVANLLAGIIFVDLLAVASAPRELSYIFLGFLIASLLAQRFVPAT